MAYKLVFTTSAEKDLERIDRGEVQKILKKIKTFLTLANPLVKAKKLVGFTEDTWRFRIGDYRAIFRLDKKSGRLVLLVILKIAHHKDVYRQAD